MDRRPLQSTYGVLELSLKDILSLIKPLEEDRLKRLDIIDNIRHLIGTVQSFRGATVEPFGSFVSNLYTKWGDLDISIELPKSIVSSPGRKKKQNLLRDLLNALRKTGAIHKFQLIPNARVPLLIFESKYSDISCDVSVDNLLGQVKSKILSCISNMDERFRDIVLLIKEWAKSKDINDPKSGTLNSYSLSLLVIFHLQTCKPPILPPLKDIYSGNVADDVTGIQYVSLRYIENRCARSIASFRSQGFNQANRSSLSEILVSFFEKFSRIETMSADYAICTYTGRWERLRSDPKWIEKRYCLYIEDPFEQPDNAARAVVERQLSRIAMAFYEAHHRLSSRAVLSDRNSLIADLVRPRVSSELRARNPRGYSDVYGRRLGNHHQDLADAVVAPVQDRLNALRLESQPSSSVSVRRPAVVHRQGKQMWRGKQFDI